MKEVDLKNAEAMALRKTLKLAEKITKLVILQKKLRAEFWVDFNKVHGYKEYKADMQNGIIYEVEFGDKE